MMMGTLLVSRILAQTAQPSITGSMMSSRIRSGSFFWNSSSALPPSPAMRTSKPSFTRYIWMRSEIFLSSSTTRMLRPIGFSSRFAGRAARLCLWLLFYPKPRRGVERFVNLGGKSGFQPVSVRERQSCPAFRAAATNSRRPAAEAVAPSQTETSPRRLVIRFRREAALEALSSL